MVEQSTNVKKRIEAERERTDDGRDSIARYGATDEPVPNYMCNSRVAAARGFSCR
jgi:hypothetical protein